MFGSKSRNCMEPLSSWPNQNLDSLRCRLSFGLLFTWNQNQKKDVPSMREPESPMILGFVHVQPSDKHQEMSIIEHVEPWLSTIFLSYDYMMLYDLLAIPLCHAAINDTTLLWTPQKVSAFAGRSCGCRAPSCLLNLWQLLGYPPTPLPCLRGRRKGRANQTVLAVPELGFR